MADITRTDAGGASGAVFSQCLTWRYTLWREWPDILEKPTAAVLWIMLNPSTADHVKLDPTVTRCREFTRAWGYTGLVVCNLFALRSTDPEALYRADDPIGPGNDYHIVREAARAGLIVCAWGNHAALHARGRAVAAALRQAGHPLHALRLNGSGHPAHPLYLPGNLRPQAWAPAA